MRIWLTITLCLISIPVMACEGFQHSMSALEHAMGIEAPAETQAAEHSREVLFQGEKLTFIARRDTDNKSAASLGVYQFKDGAWYLLKSITAPSAGTITYQQSQNSITFYPDNNRLALLTLTARDLV